MKSKLHSFRVEQLKNEAELVVYPLLSSHNTTETRQSARGVAGYLLF